MSNKDAGQLFKKARISKNLTQVEVATKAKINSNTLAKIERGEQQPSFATVKKLATVLDIDIKDIPA